MRRSLAIGIITSTLLLAFARPCLAERLFVDMTSHEVSISPSFAGTTITLFGALEQTLDSLKRTDKGNAPDDIVIVVTGPNEQVTVREKQRIFGIWANRRAVTFDEVPGYYLVASTSPLDEILSPLTREQNEIGLEYIVLDTFSKNLEEIRDEDVPGFQSGLIRQKRRSQLYSERQGSLRPIGDTLFSMAIDIPANVPVGDYAVRVFRIRDGMVVSAQSIRPSVKKIGMERAIYGFAHRLPFLYGVFAVIIAGLAGWGAALIFRER